MKMKKAVVAALATVMACGLFTGCADNSSGNSNSGAAPDSVPKAAEGEKVNLKFYTWSDEENYITQLIEQYNAQSDKAHVELVSIANDSYEDKLKVMMAAGDEADIVSLKRLSQMKQYRETGSLLDLSEMVKKSDLDISKYGAMWDSSYPDGQIYALPTRTTCWMLFYNTDLFQKAELEMPEQMTWTEYGELAKKLTVGEGPDKQWGGYWVDWYTQFYATQKGVYVNADDVTAVQESLELLNGFYNVDHSHMSLGEMKATDMQYMAEFENGKVAMMPQGEWALNMLLSDAKAGKTDVNWEIAPMPVPEGVESGTTWGEFSFVGINSKTKYAEECFDFLQYLCGPEGAALYSQAGIIHAYTDAAAESAYKQAVNKDSVSVIFNAKKVQGAPEADNYGRIIDLYNECADLYLLGEKTIEETIDNFLTKREELLH